MNITPAIGSNSTAFPNDSNAEEDFPLICNECDLEFKDSKSVYAHLFHHIRQPFVKLERIQVQPPLKITLKNRDGNSFEIVNSPTSSVTSDSSFCGFKTVPYTTEDNKDAIELLASAEEDSKGGEDSKGEGEEDSKGEGEEDSNHTTHSHHSKTSVKTDPFTEFEAALENDLAQDENVTDSRFSPDFADVNAAFVAEEDEDNEEDLPLAKLFARNAEKAEATSNIGQIEPIALPPPPAPGQSSQSEGSSNTANTAGIIALPPAGANVDYSSIPGAEPTPPPEPSPDNYPKLKVKTTGLFKDPEPERCTITEITDDNPTGNHISNSNSWNTPMSSDQDPLKLPDNDDTSLLTLFGNNERAKEFGMQSSDNEFISLDRFDERNRGAMQVYNSNNRAVTTSSNNPLDSLTGLPMQALAQQVSRLQPQGSNGQMHQQNVLINIQQYSGPPQPQYPHQGPPMYPPHYPPQPYQQPYQPYQPNPGMYGHTYPPAPGYPPQPMGPPPPQMGQMQPPPHQMGQQPPPMGQIGGPQQPHQPQQMGHPSQNQAPIPGQHMNQTTPQQGGYRPPMPSGPRGPNNAPRPQIPGQRAPGPRGPQPRGAPSGPRVRAPMGPGRPRGSGPQPIRVTGPMRPRIPGPNQNGIRPGQQNSPVKRNTEQMNNMQAKKKRIDVLTPEKDDDDCQVICMQPKNTGLPQIESVSGGNQDSVENTLMHLSDSITLKPIPPKPKPKPVPAGDAKAVANILAARGITVSSTKNKESENSSPQKSNSGIPSSLGNGSVSITSKNGHSPSKPSENLPTVDLTDDLPPNNNKGLPFRCDLCPAQYPNSNDLNKHRQTYHKTTGSACELGIPLINIKQPGMMQKLAQLGIQNFIPLPMADQNGMFALPIMSAKNIGNAHALGATQMLSLGPIRSIAKPQANNNVVKQLNMNK